MLFCVYIDADTSEAAWQRAQLSLSRGCLGMMLHTLLLYHGSLNFVSCMVELTN